MHSLFDRYGQRFDLASQGQPATYSAGKTNPLPAKGKRGIRAVKEIL